jgi:hypothetical protein
MNLRLIHLAAILGTALYLVPTGAHLAELPNKLAMSPPDYMTVQRIYAGWQLFGIVIALALAATLAQALTVRSDRRALHFALGALFCLALALADFFAFTYPVNLATNFWTVMPESFEIARRQWEYSHAAAAVLTIVTLAATTWSALVHNRQTAPQTVENGI